MKNQRWTSSVAGLVAVWLASGVVVSAATTASWGPTAGAPSGPWGKAANWVGGVEPNGVDDVAYFTNNITVDAGIAVTNKTVGKLIIGDSLGTAGNSWTFQPQTAQNLTLQASSGAAFIIVTNSVTGGYAHQFQGNQTLNLGSDLTIRVVPGASIVFKKTVTSAGVYNLTINGGGMVTFEQTDTANTGTITINNSSLKVAADGNAPQDPNLLLFAGNLLMNNALLMHQNTISRTIGTGSGQIQFTGTSVGFSGRGARNGSTSGLATLNLNNNASDIVAGSASMPPTTFNFNTANAGVSANVPLTVANSIDLGGNTVTINIGPAAGFDSVNTVTITGANGVTGAGDLVVAGRTALTVNSGLNHTGSTTINTASLLSPNVPSGAMIEQNGGTFYTEGIFSKAVTIDSGGLALGAKWGDMIVRLGGNTNQVNASALQYALTVNGPVSTGQIDFQNPINIDGGTLTLKASTGGAACSTPSGYYGSAYSVMAALSGTGTLTVSGGSGGMIVLNNPSTYAGAATIDGDGVGNVTPYHGATLFAREGKGLTSANLTLKNGGILATCGTFTRAIGTGVNQVQWTATTRGGFAAVGGDLAVTLNGNTNDITVGAANTFASLVLGSEFSTHTVDFKNGIKLGSGTVDFAVAGFVDTKISGPISGTGTFRISNAGGNYGTLVLAGNNTFGVFSEGNSSYGTVIKCGNANAFGSAATIPLGAGTGGSTTIDMAGYNITGKNLTLNNGNTPAAGHCFIENSVTNQESVWSGNVAGFNQFSNNGFGGVGNIRITGTIGTSGSATVPFKGGTGKLTLAGPSSWVANSGFSAANGRLVLDYTSDNTPKLPSSGYGTITLSGCAFMLRGNGSATTAAAFPAYFSVGPGQNSVTVSNGVGQVASLNVQRVARAGNGSTVDFNLASGSATLITTNKTFRNLLNDGANNYGGYATFNGGRTWATTNFNAGANVTNIVGLTVFNTLGTANGNIDVPAGSSSVAVGIAYNSIRFNQGVSTLTINSGQTLTLGTTIGGILMTPDATGKATIAGATPAVAQIAAPGTFVVHQYNTNYDLEVSAQLTYVNNGSFVKVGPGTLYMSNNNHQTSGTHYILGGTLRTDTLKLVGVNSGLGQSVANRPVTLAGGGRLLYTGTGDTTDRYFQLNGDGVVDASGSGPLIFNAPSGGNTVVLGGYPYNLTLQGTGSGVINGVVVMASTARYYGGWMGGTLIKKGSGAWTLNAAFNRMQLLDIRAGTLNLGHATDTIVDNGHITVEGGTLGLGANSDKVGIVTLKSGSITGTGTLQGYRYDVQSGTISPVLAGVVSALTKTTTNTVTLTGANTYLGDTLVQQGKLISTTQIEGDVSVSGGATIEARGAVGGNLFLASGSTMDVSMAALPTTLTVGGALTLTGANCNPKNVGGSGIYTITAASVTGKFASVTPPFQAYYTATTVTIGPPTGTLVTVR